MNWRAAEGSLVVCAVVWTGALPIAAYAASHAAAAAPLHLLAFGAYAAGRLICHQRPERSFHLWTAQLPVCARCTGIYVGAACAALVPAVRRASRPAWLLGIATAPALATVVYEWTSGAMPANWLRAATGLLMGAAVMVVLRGELQGE